MTFTNALILSALASDADSFVLRERMCQRLEQEISEKGTANYRMRSIAEAGLTPYPDDLDDTFCVLSAIFLHDKNRLGGEKLAQATMALTATEVEPGGPYRTWVVRPEAAPVWRDIDPVANANVAFFLGLNNIRLPKLDDYLASQIGLPASPYYPTPLHVLYFLTRALAKTTHTPRIVDTLLTCKPTNVLEEALLISSLVRCQAITEAARRISEFTGHLRLGRGFDALPVCVDTVASGVKHFTTCPEATAALCMEALQLFLEATTTSAQQSAQLDPSLTVIAAAKVLLNVSEDRTLQVLTDGFLEKLTNISQVRELTTLPLDIAEAWNEKTQAVPKQTLQNLCIAHLLGWIAYTLYDDIIDNDGTPALLSVANIAARHMYRLFSEAGLDTDFQQFFRLVLDRMDEANALELLHARLPVARLPSYQEPRSLYARSGGIMISPIGVLRLAGYSQTSPEVQALRIFFEHYLAAKQLNDDAHDWQDDLRRGHVTSVVSRVLTKLNKAYEPGDLKHLQTLFWHDVIDGVCADIRQHVARAREAAKNFGNIRDPHFFSKLIDPLEASAEQALEEREASLAFLKAFHDQKKD